MKHGEQVVQPVSQSIGKETEMKKLSAAALAVAIVALMLALVAFLTMPEGAGNVGDELKTVSNDLGGLKDDIGALRGQLAKATSGAGEVPAQVRELSAQVDKLSDRTAALDRAVAALAKRPAAAAGAPAQIDENKMRELVRNAMRAQFDRMRAARGGQQGGQQRGPTRVDLAKVPQAAKDAAAKAVNGFKVEHAHPAAKTADGKDTFYVDGNAGGRSHRVRVTAAGKVLESAPRSRHGRGRRPTQRPHGGGATPQPKTTPGSEAF